MRRKMQQGFSMVSAIFLLVVIAALGTFAVTFSTTQHQSAAMPNQWGQTPLIAFSGGSMTKMKKGDHLFGAQNQWSLTPLILSVATGKMKLHRSHDPRGNASVDAPRPVPQERHQLRSHAGEWER